MKIDLITIFPSIEFDTEKITRWGKEVKYAQGVEYFKFNKSQIFSFKYLQNNKRALQKKHREFVSEIKEKLQDAYGNILNDFAIIFDPDIEPINIKMVNTLTEDLLSFFAYKQNITHWVPIDTIKIGCFKKAGRKIYINNCRMHWPTSSKIYYTLPIEQNHKIKIRISRNELTLKKVLENLRNRDFYTYDRLFRAIKLYNSCLKNELYDQNTSVVLIASALETLFDLPVPSTTKNFIYGAKLHFGLRGEVEFWAFEFYRLRSKIVHGAKTEAEDFLLSGVYQWKDKEQGKVKKRSQKTRHIAHLEVAKEVFEECLLIQLENTGNIKIDSKYKFERINNIINKIRPNIDKIQFLIQDKKFTFDNFKKDRKVYKEFLIRLEAITPTDYSGEKIIKQLIKKITQIANDWIIKDILPTIQKFEKQIKKDGRFPSKEHLDWLIDIILKIQKAMVKVNNSDRAFELDDNIHELLDFVRQYEPIVHAKDEFSFSLAEFLDRSFGSLWGTFLSEI